MGKVITILFGFIWSLIAISSQAAYNIELCMIPLKDIVSDLARPFVADAQHMFVRGADNTGLNFEPANPLEFLFGTAKIGRQNYKAASCATIFSTADEKEYLTKWQQLVDAYEAAAKTHPYSVYNINCQWVTKKIMADLGYKMPKISGHSF